MRLPLVELLGLAKREKRSWKLRELVRQTSRIMKERADNCVIAPFSFNQNTMTWQSLVTCGESYSSPFGWQPTIQIITKPWKRRAKPPETWDQVDVEVSCTCPAFMYWGPERQSVVQNYNLPPLHGTATLPERNLYNADGTPYYTNKLCKHLILAAQVLLGEGLPEFPRQLLRAAPGEGERYEYKRRWRQQRKEQQESRDTPRGPITASRVRSFLEGQPDLILQDLRANFEEFWPRLLNWFQQVTPEGQELVDSAQEAMEEGELGQDIEDEMLEEPQEPESEEEDEEGGIVSSVVRRFLATFNPPPETNHSSFDVESGEHDYEFNHLVARQQVYDFDDPTISTEKEDFEDARFINDETTSSMGTGTGGPQQQ